MKLNKKLNNKVFPATLFKQHIFNKMTSTMSNMNGNGNVNGRAKQPPVWFDLSEIDPNQALIDIRHFTNNFASLKDQDFKASFDASINRHFGYRNRPVIIGYIPAPPRTNKNNIDVVKKVIGSSGFWLKKTTELSGVHFIWYDTDLNNFLFWAPNRKTISDAMKAIRNRLIKFYEYSLTITTPVTSHLHDGIGDDFLEFPPLSLPKLKYNHDGDWETGVTNVSGFPRIIVPEVFTPAPVQSTDLENEHRTLQTCSIKLCTRCFNELDSSDVGSSDFGSSDFGSSNISNMCLSCLVRKRAVISKRLCMSPSPIPTDEAYAAFAAYQEEERERIRTREISASLSVDSEREAEIRQAERYGCTCYGDTRESCRACWRDNTP